MKKKKMAFAELVKNNKEELLKDEAKLAVIEKRIDDKYVKSS